MRQFLKAIAVKLDLLIAVKLTLAAGLSLYIGLTIHNLLDQPMIWIGALWTVIAALMSLQTYLGTSYKAAGIRGLGTLIGTLMGGIFCDLLGSSTLILVLCIFVTTIICALMELKESMRIAAITASLIIILWKLSPQQNPWLFSTMRLLDSGIGIGCGLLISLIFFPMKAHQTMKNQLTQAFMAVHQYYLELASLDKEIKPAEHIEKEFAIRSLLDEIRNLLKESELERSPSGPKNSDRRLRILETLFVQVTVMPLRSHQQVTNIDSKLLESLKQLQLQSARGIEALSTLIKLPTEIADCIQDSLNNIQEKMASTRQQFGMYQLTLQEMESFISYMYHLMTIGRILLKERA